MAKKSLGQHFLKNKSAVHAIAAALSPKAGSMIVEIGPGHGELTAELRDLNPKSPIIAIEKDAELCADLKKRFEAANAEINFLEGDALVLLPKLTEEDQRFAKNAWNLAGNIPYYITGHLLRIVSELPESRKPERCVFTIQKEVAERIVAEDGSMNRLAASVAYWADAKIIMSLPKEDFSPMPNVASAIIVLDRKKRAALPDQDRYYTALRALFAQPRKIVLNNVVSGLKKGDKASVGPLLQDIGILPESRPQDLTVEDIAKVAEMFF